MAYRETFDLRSKQAVSASSLLVKMDSIRQNQHLATRLERSLGSLETWSFGLTGHVGWIGTAPVIHAALGPKAIFVWLPGAIVSVLLNLQVRRLGMCWPNMAGGTPNYAARLLTNYPGLGRYVAIGYFLGWSAAPVVYAIVLTDLIEANLAPLGIHCPQTLLKIGFTAIAFIVGFSGTRALGILHLFFVVPAVAFLLAFCIQGIGWLAFSPNSSGLFPSHWSSPSFGEWAKWFFIATYSVYSCETASSFVADSRSPAKTLRFLSLSAWLIPIVFLGGSWVLTQLATQPGMDDNLYLNLLAATKTFWGESASLLVTLLIAFCCLLSCATTVANTSRILYQLALDGHLSPVFAVVSRRGVLEPALIFTCVFSLLCLAWGNLSHVVMVTGTGYLVSIMGIHLGLWLRRGRPEVRWPWLSLCFFIIEAVVLVVGGLAWSWQDLLIGLVFPLVILALDAIMRRIAFAPFHPKWWQERYRVRSKGKTQDFVTLQVIVLIVLICSAVTIGWVISAKLNSTSDHPSADLLIILLVTLSFLGVAIACWTTLPQIAAIDEARKQAENLFITALDAILVLDEDGAILQVNPAAEELFEMNRQKLVGQRLNKLLSTLAGTPEQWFNRSEHTLLQRHRNLRILESTISQRFNHKLAEYIVILRDITERKQALETLRKSEARFREQALQLEQALKDLQHTQAQLIQHEKMSSLGQLVAGVAHEINNPVNFIYGNLIYVSDYADNLLSLINLYQQRYPSTDPDIQDLIADIDLEFLIEDMPKTLSSMKMGADRIRQIVLSLRNFSRLDEADMKLVNIHEGIDSTLLILQDRLKAKPGQPAVQIIKNYGDLPEVECYPGQLNQVFMNILSNAIDALHEYDDERCKSNFTVESRSTSDSSLLELSAPESSTITLFTEVVNFDWIIISIKDNGPGISDSVKSRIFDPFFTTKPVGKGTGLGLSISYQIVTQKHGGRLKCISQPGQGTNFLIEIPIKQKLKTTLAS